MSARAFGGMVAILLIAAGAMHAEGPAAFPAKRVEIDKTQQVLRAYEDNQMILESYVSTGKGDSTPHGRYRVQGKQRMPYSTASHGCIRLPLTGANPARMFYEWVEVGVPVEITGRWQGLNRRAAKP